MRLLKYVLTMLLVIGCLGGQLVMADALSANMAGKVVWVLGTLTATSGDNKERVLEKDALIYVSDTLKTDKKSQAQIVFTDHTLMTMREETTFTIADYSYNPDSKTQSVGQYIINLIEGGFRTITGNIAKSKPADYRVNTPIATMGVRGTDYGAYYHGGKLYMIYYSGTPFIENAQGTIVLTSDKPYAYVPAANQAPVVMVRQPDVFNQVLKIVPLSQIDISQFPGSGKGGSTPASGPNCEGPVSGFQLDFN